MTDVTNFSAGWSLMTCHLNFFRCIVGNNNLRVSNKVCSGKLLFPSICRYFITEQSLPVSTWIRNIRIIWKVTYKVLSNNRNKFTKSSLPPLPPPIKLTCLSIFVSRIDFHHSKMNVFSVDESIVTRLLLRQPRPSLVSNFRFWQYCWEAAKASLGWLKYLINYRKWIFQK